MFVLVEKVLDGVAITTTIIIIIIILRLRMVGYIV